MKCRTGQGAFCMCCGTSAHYVSISRHRHTALAYFDDHCSLLSVDCRFRLAVWGCPLGRVVSNETVPYKLTGSFTVPRPSAMIPTFPHPAIRTGIPGEILTGPPSEILTGIPGEILTGPPGEILTGIPGEILTDPPGEILTGPPGEILTGPPGEILTGIPGDSGGHSRCVTDWSLHCCSSRPSQTESVVSSDCNLRASSRGRKRQT